MQQDLLRERLELRERQLDAVHRISAALASKNDVDSLLRETLRVSLEAVDADAGSLLLYDSIRRKLIFVHVIGKTELIGMEIDPDQDLNGKASTVFRTGEPQITADTSTEGYNSRFDSETGYRTESILTVPLKNLGGSPIGVLQVLNKRRGHFDVGDQDMLDIVGSLAATAIVNARLAEEAQLAAVARAVGDLGHDIKNALTPIETVMQTTISVFIEPMLERLDRLTREQAESDPAMAASLRGAIAPLRDWYPEAQDAVADGCVDIREMVAEIADYIKGTQSTFIVENDLSEALREQLGRLKVVAATRRVTLEMEGLDQALRFRFDRRLVGRAVFNLVNNALGAIDDAVKRGALEIRPFHVFVRVSALQEGRFPEGGYCLIEVEDDGPGISDRVKRSLFTPHTISTTPGGTGIGTRFVKSVAEAHCGEVGVESRDGYGSKFWLKLPL